MKLHTRKLMVTMMFASAAVSGCASDQVSRGEEGDSVAIIQSRDDLNAYLKSAARSPLDRLSPAARQRFLDTLVFGEGGLGSYNYSDMEAELSVSEIHAVLSLFGVERTTSMITGARVISERDRELRDLYYQISSDDDYPEKGCEKPGDCAPKSGHICTSNC